MGLWDNTAFVQAPSADVKRALRRIFDDAGRTSIKGDVRRVPEASDPMQYGSGESCVRWAAAVFEGSNGWCAIKTAPFELLCEEDGDTPRLATLTKALACDGFQLNVFDGDSRTLIEAQGGGGFHVSGFVGSRPGRIHGFDVREEDLQASLSRLQLPQVKAYLQEPDIEGSVAKVHEHLLGPGVRVDNLIQVQHLIPGEKLLGGWVSIYGEAKVPAAVEPLEFPARLENGRLHMEIAGGVLRLHNYGFSIEETAHAPGVLAALADWLHVPMPETGTPAGPPKTIFASVNAPLESPGNASVAFTLGARLHVPFKLSLGGGDKGDGGTGRLEETSPFLRASFLEGLARAWVPAPRHDTAWCSRFARVHTKAAGNYHAVSSPAGLLVACLHLKQTRLYRHVPEKAPELIVELGGVIQLMSACDGGVVALIAECADTHKNPSMRVARIDRAGNEETLIAKRTDLRWTLVLDAIGHRVAVSTRPPKRPPSPAALQALQNQDFETFKRLTNEAVAPDTLRILSTETGEELACWEGYEGPIRWLPSGELLVSTRENASTKLRCWSKEHGLRDFAEDESFDVAPTGKEVRIATSALVVGGVQTGVVLSREAIEFLHRHGVSWVAPDAFVAPEPDPTRPTKILDLQGRLLPLARSGQGIDVLGMIAEHLVLRRGNDIWWAT